MTAATGKTALILSGGGARAAYQVGVLKAVRGLLPDPARNPFPILCGTSAGAINAAALAVRATNFAEGVDVLDRLWSNIRVEQVYRTDVAAVMGAALHWATVPALGWLGGGAPRSLLDNAPLRQLLGQLIDFERLEPAIASHALLALSLTCSGYASGQSVSFFQGRADLDPWQRGQRFGAHVILGIEHVMASTALPLLFPAEQLNREYFGDGAMRQRSPLSPAIQLGANRILVIGAGRMSDEGEERSPAENYPTPAQVAGHVLSDIFLDALAVDVARARQINQTLQGTSARMPADAIEGRAVPWRPIEMLVIEPSRRLDQLAAEQVGALPWALRTLLRGLGVMDHAGGALASTLLFEQSYTRALIELGYRDALARTEELRHFLDNA